ncbi:fumarylacetoacetate hydrolase family protein [Amycolatopsis eburnea]|uniref:2-keto-4-pentenoate hydratase n=1 Tax=Amycolatopsis eburnea TaxID=2267691 RepID=A0A3R9EPQ1_9PSEU|nr:fumarylacetoacetate hydrolase family protein [Amycolatopsis eburnea]RSD14069.1 2-keto-4-pentenoate hydratase [Amycolatopsis eburnea]
MIHHVMFFWFRKDSPQAEVEEVLEGIRSFATIPAVKDVSISENRGFPESSAPFTHAAILTFDDWDDKNAYLGDDLHQSVRRRAMSVLGELKTISVDTGRAAAPSLEDLAAQLHNAELNRRTIEPLSEQVPGLTVADSYRIQQLNVARRLRDGGAVVGHKVGLTSVAMQEQLGVDEPDYGVLFADMLQADGQPIPVSGLIQPRVEAEVAFLMDRELRGPGVTEADALEAIVGALPVIEVIDSRISAWKIGLADTIADNASCAKVVRGEVVTPVAEIDLRTIGMVLTVNGEVVSTAAGAAVLGNPIRGVVWLADKLAEFGVSLRPGDLVLAGALHASIPVTGGMSVSAEFANIGAITAEFTS